MESVRSRCRAVGCKARAELSCVVHWVVTGNSWLQPPQRLRKASGYPSLTRHRVPIEPCRNHMFPTSLSQFNGRSCNSPGFCEDAPRGRRANLLPGHHTGCCEPKVKGKIAGRPCPKCHLAQEPPTVPDPLTPAPNGYSDF